MNKINGLDVFKSIFADDDELIDHFISGIMFFDKVIVRKQAKETCYDIQTGKTIPVRYTSNDAFYLQRPEKKITPSFKNRSQAVQYTNDTVNEIFHKDTRIRIRFDRDGNYYPKRTILAKTGHKVSCGQQSTVANYVIAHIWEETDNPLYFSLMWNYCLIPSHCAYLTDKREDFDVIIKRVKNLLKAISIELYKPNVIMDLKHDVIAETLPKEYYTQARRLIAAGKIKFLPNYTVKYDDITNE